MLGGDNVVDMNSRKCGSGRVGIYVSGGTGLGRARMVWMPWAMA
jgi:hypothetical protein